MIQPLEQSGNFGFAPNPGSPPRSVRKCGLLNKFGCHELVKFFDDCGGTGQGLREKIVMSTGSALESIESATESLDSCLIIHISEVGWRY